MPSVALLCAAARVTACGTLLETGLRRKIGTERYASAPVLFSADQNVHETTVKRKGEGEKAKTKTKTKSEHKAKPVAERARLPAATVDAVRAVPGVERAVPELRSRPSRWSRPPASPSPRTDTPGPPLR